MADSDSAQYLWRLRPCQADGRPLAGVRDLHLVHDDVAPQNRNQVFRLGLIRVNHQKVAAIVNIQIPQDTALRREQKTVSSLPHRKITDVVRDHPVKPSDAVPTRHQQLSAPAEIVSACPAY